MNIIILRVYIIVRVNATGIGIPKENGFPGLFFFLWCFPFENYWSVPRDICSVRINGKVIYYLRAGTRTQESPFEIHVSHIYILQNK